MNFQDLLNDLQKLTPEQLQTKVQTTNRGGFVSLKLLVVDWDGGIVSKGTPILIDTADEYEREQPDPVCYCGKTSEGLCPRCGYVMGTSYQYKNMSWPVLLGEYKGVEYYVTHDGYFLVKAVSDNYVDLPRFPQGYLRPLDGVSNDLMNWAQQREKELNLPTQPKIGY